MFQTDIVIHIIHTNVLSLFVRVNRIESVLKCYFVINTCPLELQDLSVTLQSGSTTCKIYPQYAICIFSRCAQRQTNRHTNACNCSTSHGKIAKTLSYIWSHIIFLYPSYDLYQTLSVIPFNQLYLLDKTP